MKKNKKIKNVKVKKDVAEKITSTFGPQRRVNCIMSFDNAKLKNEKSKLGKYFFYTLKGSLEFSTGKCFFDDRRSQDAFSL